MKYSIFLVFLLAIFWLTSSGYFNGFLLSMGALTCLFAVWISRRMGIVDEESVPVQIGVVPMARYFFWLVKQIAISNKALIKLVISERPQIKRAVFQVTTAPKSSIGKVIMANSITLTPGTVTTSIEADSMQVHALVDPGLEDPTILEIDRRVRALEGV
jgi:multicomponent Na+:H+ antiporter subunit E